MDCWYIMYKNIVSQFVGDVYMWVSTKSTKTELPQILCISYNYWGVSILTQKVLVD